MLFLNSQASFDKKKSKYVVYSILAVSSVYLLAIIFSATKVESTFLGNYWYMIVATFAVIILRSITQIGLIEASNSWAISCLFLVIFLIIGIYLNISIFYYYTNDIYEFVGSDSLGYKEMANLLKDEPFSDWISILSQHTHYSFPDFGYPIIIAASNRIFDSIYTPRILNFFMAIVTYYYQRKTLNTLGFSTSESSFFAALLITSPLYLFYASSGLKETVMSTIIVLGTYFIISLNSYKKWIPIFFVATALMFFRIPVAVFFLAAAFSVPLMQKLGLFVTSIVITSAAILFLLIILQSPFLPLINAYLFAENPNNSIPVPIRIFNGLAGPPPNPSWSGLDHISWMYASGLVERTAITIPLIIGIFKCSSSTKLYSAMGAVIFVMLNTLGLIWAEQTLKARYIIPFLPAIYLIAAIGFKHMASHWWHAFLLQLPFIIFLYLTWNGLLR